MDGEDEANCTTIENSGQILPFPVFPKAPNCNEWTFKCNNSQCIPYWWKCDGSEDCSDGSDELECEYADDNAVDATTPHTDTDTWGTTCSMDKFKCPGPDGDCIWEAWLCDGEDDCPGKEDESEAVCKGRPKCTQNQFRCERSGQCVNYEQVCDHQLDCSDGSDEYGCNVEDPHPMYEICEPGQFLCDAGSCLDSSKMCDGHSDCVDGTDEFLCQHNVPTIKGLEVLENHINSTSVRVQWWMPDIANAEDLEFQPAYTPKGLDQWTYEPWQKILTFSYTYTGLHPFRTYMFKIKVRSNILEAKTGRVLKSGLFFLQVKGPDGQIHDSPNTVAVATTLPDVPSAPTITEVSQNKSNIIVKWTKPAQANGNLVHYDIEMTNPYMKSITQTNGLVTSYVMDADSYPSGET